MLVNGSNPLLLLDELRGLGECRVTVHCDRVPPLAEMEPDACYLEWEAVLTMAHPRSAIDDVFMFVADDMELKVEAVDAATAVAAPAGRRAGRRRAPVAAGAGAAPAPAHAEHAGAAAETSAKRAGGVETSTIRVPAERLDEMMDRVGELVIAQARLTQLASAGGGTKGVAEEIERLTSALRDAMMGIRMVPIGSLFGRFRRLVHDLSRDLGKEIDLTTAGEETELDKTMIERLADPLVHIIRNAADHGLEDAETRVAAGKPAAGHISLVARHAGAEVLISVSDDGRGLDAKRIRAKAEENGLIAAGAVAVRRRAPSVDLPARVLDRQGGLGAVGPRRRPGRRQAHDRGHARFDRPRHPARPGDGDHPAPAADAGDHRRPAGPRRRRALRHSADCGRGMRRAFRGRRRRARRGAASSTFAANWCRSCACANCSTSPASPTRIRRSSSSRRPTRASAWSSTRSSAATRR